MDLGNLNNIDIKDLANAKLPVKLALLAGLFVIVMFGGYWMLLSSKFNAFSIAKQEEMSLKDSFLDKKRQAINLHAYREQLVEINRSFGALLKQLPNKSQMDALLSDINQAGLGRGLKFDLFKPEAETKKDFYAELPITIKVSGTFHDFGAFASDIAQLSRIATLKNLHITSGKDGQLSMDATIETYRYLDEDELSAEKNAKNKKGAK